MPVFTLKDLSRKVNAELHGDGNIKIEGAAKIDSASKGDISAVSSLKRSFKPPDLPGKCSCECTFLMPE